MDIPHRIRIVSTLDLIFRVPPLFVMDTILNVSLPLYQSSVASVDSTQNNSHMVNVTDKDAAHILYEDFLLSLTHSCGSFLLYSFGLLVSLSIFMLSTNLLLTTYLYFSSLGLVIWSNIYNEEFISFALTRGTPILQDIIALDSSLIRWFFGNLAAQTLLSTLFLFAVPKNHSFFSPKLISACFVAPLTMCVIPGISGDVLSWSPRVCTFIALVYLGFVMVDRLKHFTSAAVKNIRWCCNIIKNYGFYTLFENQWARLQIPQVLRIFWLTRFCEQALIIFVDTAYLHHQNPVTTNSPFDVNFLSHALKELLIRGCENLVALLGMASVVASIFNRIIKATQNFLQVDDTENQSMGTVAAMLFLILALQCGLTGLEPEERALKLYRNSCLMTSASLHFLHQIVSPFLLSLSASRNTNSRKHFRAWAMCLFLLAFPSTFLYFSWKNNVLSTWLLAITFFHLELMMKVIVTLLIYALFWIDSYHVPLTRLDDYVYYIKSTGNTIDFTFGLLIFLNGTYILLFESGGTIRAITICIHAYFNLWLQAKHGWQTFTRRRSAVEVIQRTREATREELIIHNDICSVCFQEFENARITKCNHFFHEACLLKWLYVQDDCPMCHRSLYETEVEEDPETKNVLQASTSTQLNAQNSKTHQD